MKVHFIVDNVVINSVEQDTLDNPFGYFAVADENAGPGWIWNGSSLSPPATPVDYEEISRSSYQARLQGRASTLSAQGKHGEAMNLLVKSLEVANG